MTDETCYFCGGIGIGPHPDCPGGNVVEQRAVVGAARRFLGAHDQVIASDPVTRDDTFAMKNAADDLRDVLREYDAARVASESEPQ